MVHSSPGQVLGIGYHRWRVFYLKCLGPEVFQILDLFGFWNSYEYI
jgi:hypothetical protein